MTPAAPIEPSRPGVLKYFVIEDDGKARIEDTENFEDFYKR